MEGLVQEIKDHVFPYYCVGCKKEGEWWCKKCRENKVKKTIRAEGELKNLTALFKYAESPEVEELIKSYKYGFVKDIEVLWNAVIAETQVFFPDDFVIIPVPLFQKRLRERGYNQAERIAKILSKLIGCPTGSHYLVRKKETKQQAKLDLLQRLDNVKGAFETVGKSPEKVVIVDDVFTTGATMNECARVLRRNGAKIIEGFVLAHG